MIVYHDSSNVAHRMLMPVLDGYGGFRVRRVYRYFESSSPFYARWHGNNTGFYDKIGTQPSLVDLYGNVVIGSYHFEPSRADNFAKVPKAGDYSGNNVITGVNCYVKSSEPILVGARAEILPGANYVSDDGCVFDSILQPPVRLDNYFNTLYPENMGLRIDCDSDDYYNSIKAFGLLGGTTGLYISAWFLVQGHKLAGVPSSGGIHAEVKASFGSNTSVTTNDVAIDTETETIFENGDDGFYLIKTKHAAHHVVTDAGSPYPNRIAKIQYIRQPSLVVTLGDLGYVNFLSWGMDCSVQGEREP